MSDFSLYAAAQNALQSGTPEGRFLLPVCLTAQELSELFTAVYYYRNQAEDTEDERALWRSLILATIYINQPELADCVPKPDDEACVEYSTQSPAIEWSPSNPWEETTPEGYSVIPWLVFNDLELASWVPDFIEDALQGAVEDATGYQSGDVLTYYQVLVAGWENIPTFPPRFTIKVNGIGTVELHLLTVPFGGFALISVDIEPNIPSVINGVFSGNVQIVELNRDLTGVPPEFDEDAIEEIVIDEPGEHTIHVTFLPRLDDTLPLVFFGGGLRKYVLCGEFEKPEEGRIEMAEPCGCDELKRMFEGALLGAAYGLNYDAMPDGTVIETPSDDDENTRILPGTGASKPVIENPDIPTIDAYANQAGSAWKAYTALTDGLVDILRWIGEHPGWDLLPGDTSQLADAIAYAYDLASSVYDLDDTAFTGWASEVAQLLPSAAPIPAEELVEYLFCNGVSQRSVSRYALAEESVDDRKMIIAASRIFTASQYAEWSALGAQQPRTDFGDFACVLRETVEYEFAPSDIGEGYQQRAGFGFSWPAKSFDTIVYIKLSGVVTDGAIQEDPMWRFDLQNKERRSLGIHIRNGSEYKVFVPNDDFPAYSESHEYIYSIVLPANRYGEWKLFWDTSGDFGIPYGAYDADPATATGTFKLTIIDGGEA